MLAVEKALMNFEEAFVGKSLLLRSDNAVAVHHYINNKKSSHQLSVIKWVLKHRCQVLNFNAKNTP